MNKAGYASPFARFYDALTKNIDYRARAGYFAELLGDFGGLRAGALVLDFACGTGSLSFELERLGFDVIGADASADMLTCATEKKSAGDSKVLFLCQLMEELDLFGTVDAAVCALDSINHCGGEGRWLEVFRRVHLFLNPGGIFAFDANTPHKHRDILGGNAFIYDTPEVFCCWRNSYVESGCRVDVELDFFTPEMDGRYSRASERFSEWALPEDAVRELLFRAGFEFLAAFDDDSREPPDVLSERIVYVARKQPERKF